MHGPQYLWYWGFWNKHKYDAGVNNEVLRMSQRPRFCRFCRLRLAHVSGVRGQQKQVSPHPLRKENKLATAYGRSSRGCILVTSPSPTTKHQKYWERDSLCGWKIAKKMQREPKWRARGQTRNTPPPPSTREGDSSRARIPRYTLEVGRQGQYQRKKK